MRKPTNQSMKPAFRYTPKYGVIVICADELDQQVVYNDLLAKGYKLKVVCI